MTRQRGHIAGLHGHRRSKLILDGQIATHRVGSQVVELNTAQSQAAGDDLEWIQGSARKSRLKCCTPDRGCARRSAPGICDGVTDVGRLELEIELERIVLT